MAYANELVGYSNSTWLLAGLRACMANVLLLSFRWLPYCTIPRCSFFLCGRVNEISLASRIVLLGPSGNVCCDPAFVDGSSSLRFFAGGSLLPFTSLGAVPFGTDAVDCSERI